jgi:hypothetical protein
VVGGQFAAFSLSYGSRIVMALDGAFGRSPFERSMCESNRPVPSPACFNRGRVREGALLVTPLA